MGRPVEIMREEDAKVSKTSRRCDRESAGGSDKFDGCGNVAMEVWECASVEEKKFSFVGVNGETMVRKPCECLHKSRAKFVNGRGKGGTRCIDHTIIHIECEVVICPFLGKMEKQGCEESR